MNTTTLAMRGDAILYVAHLERAGFRRLSAVAIWHRFETADGNWHEGCRFFLATPTGEYTWVVGVNDRLPAEVQTVGELRRYMAERGTEADF